MLQILFGIPPFPPWAEAQELPYLSCIWSMASPPLPLIELKKRWKLNCIIFFSLPYHSFAWSLFICPLFWKKFPWKWSINFFFAKSYKENLSYISLLYISITETSMKKQKSKNSQNNCVLRKHFRQCNEWLQKGQTPQLYICVTKDAKFFISIIRFT